MCTVHKCTHIKRRTQHPQLSQSSQLIYHLAFENVDSHILTEQGKVRIRLLF